MYGDDEEDRELRIKSAMRRARISALRSVVILIIMVFVLLFVGGLAVGLGGQAAQNIIKAGAFQ